jgi:hypothetical protein
MTMVDERLNDILAALPRRGAGRANQIGPSGGDAQETEDFRTVSLRALADILDTTRSSARRWLREAGIKPIVIGRGRNGAIRYRWKEVKEWLESRERVE